MKTAWQDENLCKYIVNANFAPLAYSDHFESLLSCVKEIEPEYKKVLDIGCCAAEFADAFPHFHYCGADLPHMIEQVAKRRRPDLDYIIFDATHESFEFCKNFDVILMNSFLSELEKPLDILDKILSFSNKYVIIHRQDIKSLDNDYEKQVYDPYDSKIEAVNTTINRKSFEELLEKRNFKIKVETQSFAGLPDKKTMLIVSND